MDLKARDVLRTYWKEARHFKLALFVMVSSIVVAVVADLIAPLYYKKFFDVITESSPSNEIVTQLVIILLFVVLYRGISWLGFRFATFLNPYFQTHVITNLRQRAFDYLLHHSHSFFANSFTGSLVQRVNRLSRSFERFADRLYWDLIPLIIRIFVVTFLLWFINHTIAILMLIWVILFIVVNYFFSNWKIKYDIARAEKETQVTAALSDSVTNHPTVQSFAGAAFESKRFGKVNKALRKATRLQWNIDAVVEAVQALLFIGIEFALFYFAIKGWQNGTVSIGTFVLIQSYLIQLIMQMWDLGRVIRTVYESFADAKEMVEILETPYEIQDVDDAKKLQVNKGGIVVDSVGFSFNKTRKVLRGINITIQPGEKVALIGPSGAGKSTLVKLLMRLYDIQEGEILIDNQPIHKVTQKSLRDSISLVPQDTILFHRPIAENIRYGKRNATDEEVKRAAKLAHCEEFIKDFPEGYKTYVGERGVKLSGGERQRVAIARAILKDAPILILDEATSSLDSHSEMLIQDALEKLMKGKTTIVIAHRLSTIQKMDRIIVIDNGGVVEEGSHDELLAKKNSMYKKLWDVQAGGFLKDA